MKRGLYRGPKTFGSGLRFHLLEKWGEILCQFSSRESNP